MTGLTSAFAGKADVTHNHDTVYQEKYAGVAVVAQSGGDYTDPVTAMNDSAVWCGIPSATNPCLLKIMPGVYEMGANTLVMQGYIDVEGSGEKVTKLPGNANYSGVVSVVSNSELRFVTVESRGMADMARAIVTTGSNLKIAAVTAAVTANNDANYAVGIYNESSSVIIINTTVTVSGAIYSNEAISNYGIGAPVLINVAATATGGQNSYGLKNSQYVTAIVRNSSLRASGSSNNTWGVSNYLNTSVEISNSIIEGAPWAIQNWQGDSLSLSHSEVRGGGISLAQNTQAKLFFTKVSAGMYGLGSRTCAAVIDSGNTFHANDCP
ncbi:MAG: hypothetical protein HZA17_05855 [Nitrospirae bacterium]|nr:hypothetical protein [Nitrospirota bacterium]